MVEAKPDPKKKKNARSGLVHLLQPSLADITAERL